MRNLSDASHITFREALVPVGRDSNKYMAFFAEVTEGLSDYRDPFDRP